jgi:Nif-specific regulatory protein
VSRFNYEELATLHTIAKILTQSGELREQLEKIMTEMSKRLGMERGMISILDQKTGETWLEVARGVDIEGLDISYKPGEGITGKVAQTGRPMAIANLGKENLFLDRTGARKHLDRSQLSFLCVPIVYNGNVAGVLSADKLTHKVTDLEEEVAILSAVADLIAKAVHGLGLEEENRSLRKMLSRTRTISTDIIGNSKPMLDVLNMISQVADSGTTVLINGETGTGKELVARALHANSPRKEGPFIQVNCAAMPDTLVESELFGHEKGAFTGAIQRRRGLFEEAHGGTIFLDEIGDLSQAAQAKVLRVLQEKQLQPVGSSRTITVNVRIIAATNRNLEQDVVEGRFRADLFYRLNVFPIFMPTLRERGSDIILLADHFILKYAKILAGPGHASRLPLAGKRPRVGKLHRAGRDPGTGGLRRKRPPAALAPDEIKRRSKEGKGKARNPRQCLRALPDHRHPEGRTRQSEQGGQIPRDDEADHPVQDHEIRYRPSAFQDKAHRLMQTNPFGTGPSIMAFRLTVFCFVGFRKLLWEKSVTDILGRD